MMIKKINKNKLECWWPIKSKWCMQLEIKKTRNGFIMSSSHGGPYPPYSHRTFGLHTSISNLLQREKTKQSRFSSSTKTSFSGGASKWMGSAIEKGAGLPYRIWESSSSSSAASDDWNPTDTVLFFALSLLLGIVCRHVLRGTRIPYTVALLVVGIALGSLGN